MNNRQSFDNRPITLAKEFNIDIEEDYDYFHNIDDDDDENLQIGVSTLNPVIPISTPTHVSTKIA
jgi:hypothetical protein